MAEKKPNVIVVLTDDVGLGDISHYRMMHSDNIILETPNIDKIAESGMVFTQAHSPAALCAPSRYAIITGNSCYRSPFPWGVWGSYQKSPIKDDDLTLGRLMQNAGYKTAFFGKWHLGGDYYRKDDPTKIYRGSRDKPEMDVDITKIIDGPNQKGFDYSFTFPAGIQAVPY
ncbi:MAG: sulfatase-like hydrolase/transferase, partial [Halanaerobiales bacterium]|nr:sulfatase-like hydrolase/transferase [Halanaerobiales bacterium]